MDIPIYHKTGDDLLKPPAEGKPLIDGILWENDVVMMLGSEKAGKSILAMQMAFSLTSGEPFLDKYNVLAKTPIAYFQTEGKRSDFELRIIRMANAAEIDTGLYHHFYKKFLPLDDPNTITRLNGIFGELNPPPKVIFVDSLYTSMTGDLIDNTAVRRLMASLSPLLEKWGLALVFIHHESKEFRDQNHHAVDRGDQGSYGSVFLRAWVDHILYLKREKDGTRTFSCETQRSGQVGDGGKESLILVEPDPLIFQVKGDYSASVELIKAHILKSGGMGREDLLRVTMLSNASLAKGVRLLLRDGIIRNSNTRPTLYMPA